MITNVVWEPFSLEDRKKFNYDQLWGENSAVKDPIISNPYNVLMPKYYKPIAEKVLNFDVRPDDIWIITYPKCGTTWTQEIVWNIMNDVDKDLGQMPLFARSPFLEMQGIMAPNTSPASKLPDDPKHPGMMKKIFDESVDYADNLKSPRIIKSHLPFELLPRNLLDKAKVIYVCRNPKDTCVSYFHHHKDIGAESYDLKGTFDQFAECFMDGKLEYGSYFDHLKSGWKHRNHPNMKFVWYEDLQKNTIKEVTDMAKFVNHPLSNAKIEELVEHLKFSNMKERAARVAKQMEGDDDQKAIADSFTKFYRKGMVGDWKNYFKGEKLKNWDTWISKNLEGSDIEFNFK